MEEKYKNMKTQPQKHTLADSKNEKVRYLGIFIPSQNEFIVLLFILIFLIYPTLMYINKYIQLNVAYLFFGSLSFMTIYLLIVWIKKEMYFLALLRKSVFSNQALLTIIAGYVCSVLFVYFTTLKTVENKENHQLINEFNKVTMVYKLENIFLLRIAPIAVIQDKFTYAKAKELIELQSQKQKEIALQFRIDDEKSKSAIEYTVYFDNSKNYFINGLFLYLFVFILVCFFHKMSFQETVTRWRRSKEIIGVMIYIFVFIAIPLPIVGQSYWNIYSPLSNLLTKDISFLQHKNSENYKLIIKGK